jgi:hypothetical protein
MNDTGLLPHAPARVTSWRWTEAGVVLLWCVLLLVILATPYLTASPSLGDDLTRNTVRLALCFYAAAATLLLLLCPEEWTATSRWGQLARLSWTLAWAAYLVHLAMAFHHYHRWSHADAMLHTREVSGIGEGIYVSHLFTLAWTADVVYWWLRPDSYARRSPWWGRLLHAFMAFIIFNGTVVYEQGPIRWAGVLLFTELAAVLAYRWRRGRRQREASYS